VAELSTAPTSLLAINGGSSTVKSALFAFGPHPDLLARRAITTTGAAAVKQLLAWIDGQAPQSAIGAIGHRIVHGGPLNREPQLITAAVRDNLIRLVPFAPNHLPQEIALIDALAERRPGIPQVACFDTAFHRDIPEVARRLPIPAAYDARGIQRYGFHGLSCAFLMEELSRAAGEETARGRVVLAHLGNGSSVTAVRDGHSIDTTMAFTPIGGVVMSTRSGDLDPGVITYLARTDRLTPDELEDLLSEQSGLRGISSTTGDMQQLLTRQETEPSARLAVDSYVYSIAKAIGALTAALQGLDTLVFAGGIGEHAAVIRARICQAFGFLGVLLDANANGRHASVISTSASRVAVRVIPTNEELMIARATYRVVATD
jgi:acetate kinase